MVSYRIVLRQTLTEEWILTIFKNRSEKLADISLGTDGKDAKRRADEIKHAFSVEDIEVDGK